MQNDNFDENDLKEIFDGPKDNQKGVCLMMEEKFH